MPLLVTSASGVNGDGCGALLAFGRHGTPLGVFCNDPRIADPRGLAVHQQEGLLYLFGKRYQVRRSDLVAIGVEADSASLSQIGR
jgi:hypothetical protein